MPACVRHTRVALMKLERNHIFLQASGVTCLFTISSCYHTSDVIYSYTEQIELYFLLI